MGKKKMKKISEKNIADRYYRYIYIYYIIFIYICYNIDILKATLRTIIKKLMASPPSQRTVELIWSLYPHTLTEYRHQRTLIHITLHSVNCLKHSSIFP